MTRGSVISVISSPGAPSAQWWVAIAVSLVTHVAILGGLWMAGQGTSAGPRLTLELQTGESATIVMTAGVRSAAAPDWEPEVETEVVRPRTRSVRTDEAIGEEPSVRREISPVSPAGVSPLSLVRDMRESHPSEAGGSLSLAQPRRRTPSPASLAGRVALRQDLGVRRRAVPTKKRVPPLVYPPAAFRAGIEGVVEVLVTIDETGRVTAARVYRSSGHRILDDAAVEWVRKWEFGVQREWFAQSAELVFRAPVRFDILPPESR